MELYYDSCTITWCINVDALLCLLDKTRVRKYGGVRREEWSNSARFDAVGGLEACFIRLCLMVVTVVNGSCRSSSV